MSETRKRESGYGVRPCRGHYHVTVCGADLIYGPYGTEAEAWAMVDELELARATELPSREAAP